MTIIQSGLLNLFPEVRFGFSTKIDTDVNAPYYCNLSMSVGDDPATVQLNRENFARQLGLEWSQVALQKQIHSDKVAIVDAPGFTGESDAMLTDKKGLGLAASSGDCCAIFLYDRQHSMIGAVHSGWRGTEKRILTKALLQAKTHWNTEPENLFAYIAPAITWQNYEVGPEVALQFDEKYIISKEDRLYLDVTSANFDMLVQFGVPKSQIQVSSLCSYGMKDLLHSYRRDGAKSGRAYGLIYLRDENA